MIYNEKIDVIIPAYNVPDNTLFRALSSIACQDRPETLEVTIVDDASTEQNYAKVIELFKPILKINLLRYETNGGPGVARQYGLDHTQNEFFCFMDADDVWNGHFAISKLVEILKINKDIEMVVSKSLETVELEDASLVVPMEFNMIWVFGKMYRRSFLEKYDIRFHDFLRANEDGGFNAQWEILLDNTDKIAKFDEVTYIWLFNKNSITREDQCSYNFRDNKTGSFYGFVENMIYAIEECKKKSLKNIDINFHIVRIMISIYLYYLECLARGPQYAESNLKYCKKFFDKLYKDIEDTIPVETLSALYWGCSADMYNNEKGNGFIPSLTYFAFLDKLREE